MDIESGDPTITVGIDAGCTGGFARLERCHTANIRLCVGNWKEAGCCGERNDRDLWRRANGVSIAAAVFLRGGVGKG